MIIIRMSLIMYRIVDDDAPYMVFEYMEHGDLADLLRRNDPAIGRGQAVELKQVHNTASVRY